MTELIVIGVLVIGMVWLSFALGKKSEQDKSKKLDIKTLQKHEKINTRRDLDRPTLYKRLFNKK